MGTEPDKAAIEPTPAAVAPANAAIEPAVAPTVTTPAGAPPVPKPTPEQEVVTAVGKVFSNAADEVVGAVKKSATDILEGLLEYLHGSDKKK